MVGAVDPRVNCLIPMVETFVGMHDILHGHFQALGGWSFAFDDYYREGRFIHRRPIIITFDQYFLN